MIEGHPKLSLFSHLLRLQDVCIDESWLKQLLPEMTTSTPAVPQSTLQLLVISPVILALIMAWQRMTSDPMWQNLKRYLTQNITGNIFKIQLQTTSNHPSLFSFGYLLVLSFQPNQPSSSHIFLHLQIISWLQAEMFKNLLTYLRVIPVITTYYVIEKNVISASNADGVSMEPTIRSGDIVVIDRFTYKYLNRLRKNDIVVAIQPVNPQISICKRIVEVGGGIIPYGPGIKVPEKHYWLEGDNKKKSYDSRHHGCVPENLILGRVLFVIPIQ